MRLFGVVTCGVPDNGQNQRWPSNEKVVSRGLGKLQREILQGIGTEGHDLRGLSKLLPARAKRRLLARRFLLAP